MKLRTKNNTTIQYILVSNGSPIITTILPPEVFESDVVDFIKSCPVDIIQLIDSVDFLELYLRNAWSFGYDFSVFNIKDFDFLEPLINSSPQIQLFFLDGSSKEHKKLYEKLNNDKSIIRYFHFYNSENGINSENGLIVSPIHFIETIINQQEEILNYLKFKGVQINPSVFIGHKEFHEFYYFVPTRTNFFLINRIIGNFGYCESDLTLEQREEKHIEETSKALKAQHSFERQKLFINQVKKIDYYFNIAIREKILNPTSSISPYLPSLILVVPFHNPDLKEIYGDKNLTDLLQVEQTENYINLADTKQGFRMTTAGMEIQRKRIKYLDDISFLHSSFSFSPTIRLPLKGKSLYRELSFFRPSSFPNISIHKNRRKLKKTIYMFGKALKEKTISFELENLIKRRNGQIIAISDLPIEWTLIDGIPLSFTHDICRLPETSLHGLMSFYTYNQVSEYSVPEDILKKTLIILGSNESSFKKWHEQVYELSKRDGFSIVQCNCLNDVKQAIDKLKPDFLIFDCHGGYDDTTRSSYLLIGDEILDGNYVVKNQISAPIIFLSACGTAPTYGTMNPIANAFFESGAISVTSTFLPIDVDTGSILYLRVLNNLSYAANHVIHKNWLEFICHLIRTSSINEAYRLALNKDPSIESNDYFVSNVTALTESLVFSKRRELYKTINNKISSMTNVKREYYSEVVPEYLLYTNLGRGDLILFDKWKEDYLKKNVC